MGSGWSEKQAESLSRGGREPGVALSQGLHVWSPLLTRVSSGLQNSSEGARRSFWTLIICESHSTVVEGKG